MKELSFYEQAGLVVPGSGLLLGVLVLEPNLQPFFVGDGISIGGLGVFVLIAYGLGHLVAAFGNLIEGVVWRCADGMPSQWPRDPHRRLLHASQRERLFAKLRTRLGIEIASDVKTSSDAWRQTFGLLYRDVIGAAPLGRIETFNGTYGLNRGLATSAFLLIPLVAYYAPAHWLWWCSALAFIGAVYLYRMVRFGRHFAVEVYTRFLLLPDDRTD